MTGTVVVVTGASSGIGQSTADMLLAQDITVASWDLKSPNRGFSQEVDICDGDAVATAAKNTVAEFGRIDAVVNCAGLLLLGSLADTSIEKVRRLFDVNVMGTTLVTQALLPHLIEARGAIVNVASSVAIKATPSNAHYAASKAAVAQLTRCWALELGPSGVRVNAVAPGPTATNIYANAGMSTDQAKNLLSARATDIPLRRTGHPQDIARWIVRLALADEWVTGQVIAVDGGMSIM